ncbi:PDZ domain-containing protein [Thiohalocapsa marina]|uniref:PDZ domain-containing protein n=2 Tax=Thiohalocapsa marina TaxID=424902 RepID=A0A5M8FTE9_9GAMM|nr:PDZ domain-containing protein [Thiohalocapsa marina]
MPALADDAEPATAPAESTPPAAAAPADQADQADALPSPQTAVIDSATITGLDALLERIADRRVVFVGESHDAYEDHLNQLAIIQGLHQRGKAVGIGMEFFQQPFQPYLDAYVAGELDEAELLRQTEYFERWRFDYRLYRPILRYAREHGLPLVALNIEREITEKVGDGGIDALTEAERARIPAEIDRDDVHYRGRIKAVFDMHPKDDDAAFERFLDVQLLWDEGMAERAADWLQGNPDKTLVVLAGVGHVEYGHGIPSRVTRRVDVPAVTVVSGAGRPFDPAMADFVLYPSQVDLPRTGLLGVMLETEPDGEGLGVQAFAETSGAKDAGVKQGDRIVRVGDSPIASYADIRIALMDSRPGQRLPVEIRRQSLLGGTELLRFEVELH